MDSWRVEPKPWASGSYDVLSPRGHLMYTAHGRGAFSRAIRMLELMSRAYVEGYSDAKA